MENKFIDIGDLIYFSVKFPDIDDTNHVSVYNNITVMQPLKLSYQTFLTTEFYLNTTNYLFLERKKYTINDNLWSIIQRK